MSAVAVQRRCRHGFRRNFRFRIFAISSAPRKLGERLSDGRERAGEVGNLYKGQKQPDNPEDMIMCEKRYQREDRYNFHLHLVSPVSPTFRECMQLKV